MTEKIARVTVIAGCAYLLLYLGLSFLTYSHLVAVPIMCALMGLGAVAGRQPAGPRIAMIAGGSAAFMAAQLLISGRGTGGQVVFASTCVAVGGLVLFAGWRLAKAQKQDPTEPV